MPTQTEYRNALKTFIKDKAELNRLLKFTVENLDDELDLYIEMAIGFLNAIPPFITPFTIVTFPIPSLILHQATIECLISNGILQARNELTYNNGGITVKVSDGDRYTRFYQILTRMADQEINALKELKIAININGGYGGVYSPYGYLHGRGQTLNPNTLLSG